MDASTIAEARQKIAELEQSLKAWDYPPRGGMQASCGHKLHGSDSGECLDSYSWDTFSDGGYGPCIMSACYCPWCAIHLKVSGYLVPETEAA